MTQHVSTDSLKKKTLPIAGQPAIDVDAELSRFEAEERSRLGLQEEEQWLEKMANLSFTKKEKGKITLLIGGLTMAHDYLVSGGFRSLGYTVVPLDCPNNDALRVGKEFGNRGQCNPTYFTVGNLVKFLIYLRDEKGLTTKQVVDDYVFLTAGACGPCRFGMYVTEYRKALRDAGFDGFRVMLFQQQGGLSQATGEESGLELTPPFFIALLKGLLAGDIINGMGYRLRPYEVVPGSTDKAIAEAKKLCYDALQQKKSVLLALRRAKKVFEAVEVDRLMVKPKVAIIGEFWAMTTEGDGNYALQRFLESEGAEEALQRVVAVALGGHGPELADDGEFWAMTTEGDGNYQLQRFVESERPTSSVTAWILYNIWEVRFDTASRALLKAFDGGKYGLNGVGEHGVFVRKVGLWLGDKALRTAFQTFAHAGGFYGYHLPDMDAVADVAAPYYNNDLRGGEGHMEVGKLILNVVKNKATMTLSVKPFGCMPSSSVSDGVQSLITEKFPGTIYCAVETSGDGAVNFYSRVQMYMFKAKQAAAAELEKALSDTGLSLEQVKGYLKQHKSVGSPLHKAPHFGGTTTADLVYEVAELYGKSRWYRAAIGARNLAKAGVELVTSAARVAPEKLPQAARVVKAASIELGEIAKEKGPVLAQQAANAVREKLAAVVPFVKPKAPAAEPIAAE